MDAGVQIGFEGTLEQDAAFGIRQLVDVACKALSPAVNDPCTAAQAVDPPVGDLLCARAASAGNPRRPGRRRRGGDRSGTAVPEYLAVMCGLIRRYGAREPAVAHALLRLLGNCAAVAGDDPERCAAIEEQARIVVADASEKVAQPADLAFARAEAQSVRQVLAAPARVTLSRRP